MPSAPGQKGNNPSKQLAAIDRLLIAGMKQGPAKKREAINRILELVPDWTRGDCWQRIRHLRKTPELAALEERYPDKARKSEKSRPIQRSFCSPWTPADDDRLLNLAGYEPVKKIAQRLGRSVRAVRFRLGALGMSARVTDGWSLRALRKLLRASPARLRYLIGNGMLRVRDPRISASSLAVLRDKIRTSLDSSAIERIRPRLWQLAMTHTRGIEQRIFLACPWPKCKPGFPPANFESWTPLSPTGRLKSSARSTETRSI